MKEKKGYVGKTVWKIGEDGDVLAEYASIKEAAERNGLSYRYLLSCVRQGRSCHGMSFEYEKKVEKPIKPECGAGSGGAFIMPSRPGLSTFQAGHNPLETYRARAGNPDGGLPAHTRGRAI